MRPVSSNGNWTEIEIRSIIREEISRYFDEEFSDTARLCEDLYIDSDDLSAVALTLEDRFGMVMERSLYRNVHSVDDYTKLIAEHLRGPVR